MNFDKSSDHYLLARIFLKDLQPFLATKEGKGIMGLDEAASMRLGEVLQKIEATSMKRENRKIFQSLDEEIPQQRFLARVMNLYDSVRNIHREQDVAKARVALGEALIGLEEFAGVMSDEES